MFSRVKREKMKKAIFCGIAIALSAVAVLTFATCQKPKNSNATPIVEQRNLTGIDPFAQATRVELVTYKNDRTTRWVDKDGIEKPLIENGMLTMPADSIRSIKELNANQKATWQHALYVQHFCQDNSIGLCYQPRHLLLFYAPDNHIFAYIEICISCGSAQFSDEVRRVIFCEERVNYVSALVMAMED
jgi:hypothetical protein